ncbi:MAG: tryptophan synthase subunit beta, partial [Gammaproteobacteria bacterium]
SSHAIAWVAREAGQFSGDDIVVINLSGRGDKDILTVAALDGITL